jgi:two-component system cell cycle response regulator DivK
VSSRQVLVVEDNERSMKLFRDVLLASGYRMLEATTGAQAVELVVEHVPDLVLMDIHLPDVDGVEALGRLRADARTEAVPVLALTAQAMEGDRERFLAAGFDGYLSKPVNIRDLLATVERYCRRGGQGHQHPDARMPASPTTDLPPG